MLGHPADVACGQRDERRQGHRVVLLVSDDGIGARRDGIWNPAPASGSPELRIWGSGADLLVNKHHF